MQLIRKQNCAPLQMILKQVQSLEINVNHIADIRLTSSGLYIQLVCFLS